jgi:predicted permease
MWTRVRSWLASLMQRKRIERDMADEMEFHLAARTEDLIRRGLSREEASRQARLEFGAVEGYKEKCRESLGLRLVDELRADLRYSWRQLGKSPTFSILAVAILAIGIGANTAVFSAIDAVLLRMLPVKQPEQLRRLEWTARRTGFCRSYNGSSRPNAAGERLYWSISYPVYQYLRDHTSTFSGLITFSEFGRVGVTIRGHAELAGGQIVSGDYFTTLGANALFGRILAPEDDQPGGLSSVAVLSYAYWQRRFGGDAGVLGQTISVNGTPVVIVGVLPKGWCGVNPYWCPDLVLPMALQPVVFVGPDVLKKPDHWYFEVMGRLKVGVAEEHARAEMELLLQQAILGYQPRDEYDSPRVSLRPGGSGVDSLRYELSRPLTILAWAVGAVLLIACANLAGLLLARATARQREMGMRLALGAGRGRLIRQLLTESLLLSALGGGAGIVLAHLVGDSIARLFVRGDQPLGVEITLNLSVLAFSIGLCTLTGIAFGLAPALRATRVDLLSALKTAGASGDRLRFRLGKGLIAVQVALSLVLAVGSALFVRTVINLRSESLGFRPENLLVFQLNPTLNGYREQRLLNLHEEVVKRIAELPGVRSASMSRWGLLSGSRTSDGVNLPGQKGVNVDVHYVCPRFFETMGIPLLLGRDMAWTDRENSQRVMAINETLTKQLFPGQNPVGQTLQMGNKPVEIIGVAGDTKFDSLRAAVRPTVYVPFRQNAQFSMTYAVRSEVEPKALIAAVRRAVESVDRNVPLYEVRTQAERINESMRRERLFASLLSGFALLALALACLGIYGTLAYLVTRRTPEIGIRLALGAKPADVVSLVLRESTAPVMAGVVIGIAGSLAAGRLVESTLYGLRPRDPVTLLIAAAVLAGSALLAGWLPAHRASRIAPMEALRHE